MLAKLRLRFSPRLVVVCVGIALIPLIYAGLLVWSNVDPTHNLSQIPASIVNSDQTAEAADGTAVALGDDLTDELIESEEANNFDWSAMSADEASAALQSGEVLAVLTIPDGFSAAALSAGSDDVADARQAKLTITTNDGANLIIGSIASTVSGVITDTLRTKVSESYLENIYLGFTDVHDSISDAADGALTLADGTTQAKDGSGELVIGLDELAAGTNTLSDGAQTLAAGVGTATNGATALADGLVTLNRSAASAPSSATQLATGASTTAAGAADLATGASSLAEGTASLSDGAQTVAAGAASVSEGSALLADSLGTLTTGAQQVADGSAAALDGAVALRSGATAAVDGATSVDAGIDALIANYALMTDEQRLAALDQLSSGASALVGDGSGGLTALAAGTGALVGDETSGLTLLSSGARSVASGSQDAADALSTLAGGAAQLSEGASALSDGATSLDTGATQLADGASRVSDGTAQVADGAGALSSGVNALATAIGSATDGATQLAEGMPALRNGANTLADGASTVSSGTASAADGASSLDDGLAEISTGASELSDGLVDGVSEIPRYTDDEASGLAAVSADSVTLDAERMNEVPEYGYGLAPYFMALSLWVGALAFYLMMPALRARLVAGRRGALSVALSSLAPGAIMAVVQSALMVLIVHFGVGIELVNLPGAFGLALLTSITFFAINQALIALLDAPGRFVALILMVFQLASAGGTYPIQTAPELFQRLNSWLPLTYPVEAFRSMIAGGSIGVLPAIGMLSCWLVGAIVVAAFAVFIKRRRTATDADGTADDIDDDGPSDDDGVDAPSSDDDVYTPVDDATETDDVTEAVNVAEAVTEADVVSGVAAVAENAEHEDSTRSGL